MNKRVMVVVSSLMLSTPIFAKSIFDTHAIHKSYHTVKDNLNTYKNYSGLWVGHCDQEDEKTPVTIKITQDKKILPWKI